MDTGGFMKKREYGVSIRWMLYVINYREGQTW